MLQDLRTAFRVLAKSPGATALSVLSIAFGIGITVGMFGVGDAMLLRPMPFHDPGKVLRVWSHGDDGRSMLYGWPDYVDMAAATRGIAELAAYERMGLTLTVGDETDRLLGGPVTPNFFKLLGVRAQVGRAVLGVEGGRPQVVLGYHIWQRRFGGDPAIAGKTVLLNRQAFVVSGVMPKEFTGMMRTVVSDAWISNDAWFHVLNRTEEEQDREGQWEIAARLKQGVSTTRAAAMIDAAIRGVGKHKPAPAGTVGTLMDADFAPTWKDSLQYGGGLLACIVLVLFVACANVAQMRMAQTESRRRELAVRMALGSGTWRIGRGLVVETAAITGCGAALGILLARLLMQKTGEFLTSGRTYNDYGIRMDLRVLCFALFAIGLAILFSGLGPARQAVRLNIAEILKSEQGSTGARGRWQKKLLVAGQIAVSVALFGTAALFLASLRNATVVHPGLDPQKNVYAMVVGSRSRTLDTATWCEQACQRLATVGGVRGATWARRLPLSGSGDGLTARVEIPGLAPMGVLLNNVGGNYFDLLGTRVMAGRGISLQDRANSELVAVVSQTFARQVFPSRNPIGEWVRIDGKMRQVVGVAEDGPSSYLHEPPAPYLFLPFSQAPGGDITLMVETAGRPEALARQLRAELRRFDPRASVNSGLTLRQQMDEALSQDRLNAMAASGLGIFGVLLAAAGLFGVLTYAVNRRTRELGLRMALGARPAEIQRLVLGESLRIAAWGIPIGLLLLAGAAKFVQSRLLGVEALDSRVYLLSAGAVLALTLMAAWLPSRRATRVNPVTALRAE